MSDQQFEKWVNLAVKNDHIFKNICNINIHGKSSSSDGYIGNIFYITVSGITSRGHKKSLDLVIKCSKESVALREQAPVKEAFLKEIFMYDHVLKAFDDLQKEKYTRNLLRFVPHCYASQTTNTSEVLIFENLKTQGYDVTNRNLPMDDQHVKLVLQACGKWHAFSLALKKHKRDLFAKLAEGNDHLFINFIRKMNMVDLIFELFKTSRDACVAPEETELLQKLQFSQEDAFYNFTGLLKEEPDYQVIVHGDCWNNNFMFKSKVDTNHHPSDVRIIDWQCAGVATPVFDLSHFIYSCCDTGNTKNVNDLLKIYHESLSTCLAHLDCDAHELFPYSKLIEHWRKYSRYGIILHGFILKMSMCEADDAPDFAKAADEGRSFLENFTFDLTNAEQYHRRIRNNLVHYVENLE